MKIFYKIFFKIFYEVVDSHTSLKIIFLKKFMVAKKPAKKAVKKVAKKPAKKAVKKVAKKK